MIKRDRLSHGVASKRTQEKEYAMVLVKNEEKIWAEPWY